MTQVAYAIQQGPRENIEDAAHAVSIRAADGSEVVIGVVMDGVGGEHSGEVASAIAVQQIVAVLAAAFALPKAMSGSAADISPSLLVRAFEIANEAIVQTAAHHCEFKGMATTAVCFLIHEHRLLVAWRGDSRCYLWRAGQLRRLTRDHSNVQILLDAGLILPEQARFHPEAHVINRYLGQPNQTTTETVRHSLSPGDCVVLCSDGLTDVVSDTEIAQELRRHESSGRPVKELTQSLARRALNQHTCDNTTVLCCEYAPAEPEAYRLFERTQTQGYPAAFAAMVPLQPLEEQNV